MPLLKLDLLKRIQNYIATDLNSEVPAWHPTKVTPESIHIISFTTIAQNWRCRAASEVAEDVLYDIVYFRETDQYLVTRYKGSPPIEAVL